MNPRILPGLVAIASALLVSCYPYQENQGHKPKPGAKPNPGAVAQSEQAKQQAQEAEQKRAEEEKRMQAEAEQRNDDLPKDPAVSPPDSGKKPDSFRSADYPVAKAAPGKEGFVLSPYNNKIIDVRDDAGKKLARGTLVSDPTYPATEKKYFRVP